MSYILSSRFALAAKPEDEDTQNPPPTPPKEGGSLGDNPKRPDKD